MFNLDSDDDDGQNPSIQGVLSMQLPRQAGKTSTCKDSLLDGCLKALTDYVRGTRAPQLGWDSLLQIEYDSCTVYQADVQQTGLGAAWRGKCISDSARF